MANSPQALKRARQAEKRRLANQGLRTAFRTMVKRARAAAGGDGARAAFVEMQAATDKAARLKLIHPRTAARIKSRVTQRMKTAIAEKAAAEAAAKAAAEAEAAEKAAAEKPETAAAKPQK